MATDVDPTAHAEINAIRKACKKLNTFHLEGCTIYTTNEPCPMCYSAIRRWARLERVVYGQPRGFSDQYGFDDEIEIEVVGPILKDKVTELFEQWKKRQDKVLY